MGFSWHTTPRKPDGYGQRVSRHYTSSYLWNTVLVTLVVLGVAASRQRRRDRRGCPDHRQEQKPLQGSLERRDLRGGASLAGSGALASMEMRKKQFAPRVVVVQKGSPVEFPNRDRLFTTSSRSPGRTASISTSTRRRKSARETFEHVGVVRVYCNIHPQMTGIVMVRTPVLRDLREGWQLLDRWHPSGPLHRHGLARARQAAEHGGRCVSLGERRCQGCPGRL